MVKESKLRQLDPSMFDMSEDDEEYVPTQDEVEYLKKRSKFMELDEISPAVLKHFEDMNTRFTEKVKASFDRQVIESGLEQTDSLKTASEIVKYMQNLGSGTDKGIVHFAGKLYKISKEGEMVEYHEDPKEKGMQDLMNIAKKYNAEDQKNDKENGQGVSLTQDNLEENEYRELIYERQKNLKSLIALLNNRHRNVSAIFKSRVDWKKFTKINNLEKNFKQNRISGYLEDQRFLNKMEVIEKNKRANR